MNTSLAPSLFEELIRRGCIAPRDIYDTDDGFRAAAVSLSDILAARAVTEFCDSEGHTQPCALYFDDWYIYAVPYLGGHVYSLFKLREQEYDGGDGNTPGSRCRSLPLTTPLSQPVWTIPQPKAPLI